MRDCGRQKGAKIVTFETRLSNTAALSDEWFCVKPGPDGIIALAMANVICQERLWDKDWFDTWATISADEYADHLREYTPERAAEESGVPAGDIARIAREFADAAPRSTTNCNRGTQAHRNGYYNDRAVTALNALVGSMGREGGRPRSTTGCRPCRWGPLSNAPDAWHGPRGFWRASPRARPCTPRRSPPGARRTRAAPSWRSSPIPGSAT